MTIALCILVCDCYMVSWDTRSVIQLTMKYVMRCLVCQTWQCHRRWWWGDQLVQSDEPGCLCVHCISISTYATVPPLPVHIPGSVIHGSSNAWHNTTNCSLNSSSVMLYSYLMYIKIVNSVLLFLINFSINTKITRKYFVCFFDFNYFWGQTFNGSACNWIMLEVYV